jgi:GDP-mannose 6-dehydrogenase
MAREKRTEQAEVAVLGLGYVGCVTAACFAGLGHRVIGVDRDEHKVDSVSNGHSPFYEPGLEELIAANLGAGRLSATTSTAEALAQAKVVFVCVGTPSQRNGNIGLEQLLRVCAGMADFLNSRPDPPIVVIRSTVFPGTCDEVVGEALGKAVPIVANPEFLREGSAVRDFMEPSLIVVGGSDPGAVKRVADLYGSLGVAPCLVSLRTAEMIKYACNSFHAVKIAFANEFGTLCGKLGVSAEEVMNTLCQDTKLNISSAYLKPGLAFGGSCLPKDLRALIYRATRLDLKLSLLESVLPSNEQHLQRDIQAVLDLREQRIGIFGLAFKANTDDLRESPVVTLIEQLLGKGREVRVFDPHIQLEAIYGSNRSFLISTLPHIGKFMDAQVDDMLNWAEAVVVTQQPDAQCLEKIERSRLPILRLDADPAARAIHTPAVL